MKNLILGTLIGVITVPAIANAELFGGEIILGTTDQEIKSDYGSAEGDDTSFGVRGAYNLNKSFALELSYMNYGEAEDSYVDGGDTINDKISSSAFNFGLKGSIPFENGFSLFARLGLSFWDVELEETDSAFGGVAFKGDDSGNDFYYGVGAQYLFNSRFTIGAEYFVSEYGIKPNGDFQGFEADLEVRTIALTAGMLF